MAANDPALLTVLIGDLRGSRDLDPVARTATQETIQGILADLTQTLPPGSLATQMVLTAGDEVQAVFHQASAAATAIQELTDRLYGSGAQLPSKRKRGERHDWRDLVRQGILFGVGRGELFTGSLSVDAPLHENPGLLDGPAFHRARTAIDRAKKCKRWVSFEGFPNGTQETLETLFDLMGSIRSDWASAQWIYTHERRSAGSQKELAQKFLLSSASVVSESLKAAHYEAVLRGEETARRLLAQEEE